MTYVYFPLLLVCTLLIHINVVASLQSYTIRKDFFSGFKAAEFSITDSTGKRLYYRIESGYSVLPSSKVIAHPSRQEIGRLQVRFQPLVFNGEFSILDPDTNQWSNGFIRQAFKVVNSVYNIEWNHHQIKMETNGLSLTTKFTNDKGELLAQYKVRPASMFWAKKYDMTIYSKEIPAQLFFLALAAGERNIPRRG